jgi:hypothetical protein
MDVASLNLKFPILGFTTDDDVCGFPSLHEFGLCGPRTIKNDMQRGMEIVDCDGRRYRVRSIRKVGRLGSLPIWFLHSLVSTPQYRIQHELEPREPLSLEEIKQRVDVCIRAHPLYWSEEADFDSVLVEQLANAQACGSVAEIFEVLGLDWFASY